MRTYLNTVCSVTRKEKILALHNVLLFLSIVLAELCKRDLTSLHVAEKPGKSLADSQKLHGYISNLRM